ncbi:Ribosomal large subunit pseudouridine synthase D [Clostridium liquoris]|jgi:23S rRNA pseudouridine1911/1915/1917 synthase|uniref:Pseudouridine synthase n=1 Tax=Clostridium liquoris TaxID=1289519 RepID=A0A2T0B178_9CLOT|nr:RluA family pseudouridine synthase [Clostridium liquoris]PRR77283.1 Ribosomal large subunit pseudouridine synthase D [Clostridium liquoris]
MSSLLNFKYDKSEKLKLKEFLRVDLKLSGRLIRGAAKEGRIRVNGKRADLKHILNQGDIVDICVQRKESQNIEPEKMDLSIVYEDEDIIVVNKSPGMVVHPTKSHPNGTLANGLLYYFKSKGENCIVRLVSRLDMDTSGLIIVAKNQFSHMALARDMGENTFKKGYLAVAHGVMEKPEGIIDLPIYRPGEGNIKRIVDDKGQRSITHYNVVENYDKASLISLSLETGRTHQIRVHLTHLGHPLFGDALYGEGFDDSNYINRQALHAYRLSFPHPRTGRIINLECDLPKDINNLIDILRKRANN